MRLQILRHAPPLNEGCLAGRRDIDADCSDGAAFMRAAQVISAPARILCSPARRCQQTARALGYADLLGEPRLWEQDFGDWEGVPLASLPDLGQKPVTELAAYRPPNGESFDDMCRRVTSFLKELQEDSLIVAHAGTARAALSQVVGAAALSFAIAPLSLTILQRMTSGEWSVEAVNLT